MNAICKDAGEKGRGVFATRDLNPGDIIEDCPVLEIPKEDEPWLERSFLQDYVYEWGRKFDRMALPLGLAMLYNHSYAPNARYLHFPVRKALVFVAIREIKLGEEITINYNYEPDSKDKVWFDVK